MPAVKTKKKIARSHTSRKGTTQRVRYANPRPNAREMARDAGSPGAAGPAERLMPGLGGQCAACSAPPAATQLKRRPLQEVLQRAISVGLPSKILEKVRQLPPQ